MATTSPIEQFARERYLLGDRTPSQLASALGISTRHAARLIKKFERETILDIVESIAPLMARIDRHLTAAGQSAAAYRATMRSLASAIEEAKIHIIDLNQQIKTLIKILREEQYVTQKRGDT